MLNYTISNPAAPQNANPTPVYLGQANTLAFTCSVNLNMQAQSGDKIYISLDARLLSNPAAVTLDSENWQLDSCTLAGNKYEVICVLHNPFSLLETFVIKLLGLTPQSACIAQIGARAQFGGRPYSGSINSVAIMNPPSGHKDLSKLLAFTLQVNDFQQDVSPKFYLSDAGLQTPLANTLHLIVTCNTLPLNYDGTGAAPGFNLSFTYGDDAFALTDALKSNDPNFNALSSAWNIQCQTGAAENNHWQVIPPDTTTDTPNWRVSGRAGALFSSNAPVLDVLFSHVISRLPEGTAVLYIQWTNFKGYDDGVVALPIPKYKAEVQVLAFNSPQNDNTIAFGQPVTLNWTVFGGKQVAISWDEGLRKQAFSVYNGQTPALTYTGELTVVPDSHEAKFYIAQDGQAADTFQVAVTVSDFPPPQIATFEGALTKLADNSLVVQLNVLVNNLGNSGVFQINGVAYDAAMYNGLPFQLQFPAAEVQFPQTYTLIAIDKSINPNLRSSSTITVDLPAWIYPEIKSFEGVLQKDSNGSITGLAFQFQLANFYPFTTCLLNETPVSPGPDGKGVLNLPVNAENPLCLTYVLTCTNPIVASVSSTLSLQYVQTNSYSTSGGRLVAMAVCVQRQSLIGLFSGDNLLTIKECPLNDPGNWDAGVVFQNGSDAHLAPFPSLVLAPDGSQALLCGHSFYGIVYKDNQWVNTLYPLTKTDNESTYVGLPGAYAPDMSLAYINGYYNVSYFKPDPATYQPDGYVPVKTVFADNLNAISIAVTNDGSKVFVYDAYNRKIWYFDTDNIPEDFSAGINAPSGGQVLLTGKGHYLYFAGNSQIFGMDTSDANNMSLVKLADIGQETQFLYKWVISSDGTLLVFRGMEVISFFSVSASDPARLKLLNEIRPELILDVAISPDNTRVFISKLGELLVYEAQLLPAQ